MNPRLLTASSVALLLTAVGCAKPRPEQPFAAEREPAWVGAVLADADAALAQWPPASPPPVQRQEALMALDGPLHLRYATRYPSVRRFYAARVERAIEQIETAVPADGTRVWRLYNHGFVVRTPTVTIGFDLKRGWDYGGPDSFEGVSDAWLARLAARLDLAAISHPHADHVDRRLVRLLFARGVPVLSPPGAVRPPADRPELGVADRQPAPTDDDPDSVHRFRELRLANGQTIQYVAYPGHQGGLANNCCLVRTPEGLTFLHTGDQNTTADWAWIDQVGRHHRVDVLMVNCWTNDLRRLIAGVRPRLVLTGHEVEMGHAPAKREAYWQSLRLFRNEPTPPAFVLCWGESVAVPPAAHAQEAQ